MRKKNEEQGETDTERGWGDKCDTDPPPKKKARKKQKRVIKRWEREKKESKQDGERGKIFDFMTGYQMDGSSIAWPICKV